MSFSLFLHGHGLDVAPDAVNQSSHALNAGFGWEMTQFCRFNLWQWIACFGVKLAIFARV